MAVFELAASPATPQAHEARPDDIGAREFARVVAITAARPGTAKRGLAAGIGRALARLAPGDVCVVDADRAARDVGDRFGVAGPTVAQVAATCAEEPDVDLPATLAREAGGCFVVPLPADNRPVDPAAFAQVLRHLRRSFAYIVVDAPIAFAMHRGSTDGLVDLVDDLFVATAARPGDVSSLVRYVNTITRGRVTGEIPPALEIRVVPTGSEAMTIDATSYLARTFHTVEITDVMPPLWGRDETPLHGDAATLPEPLVNVVRRLDGVEAGTPRVA